jgi:hypothetical protein
MSFLPKRFDLAVKPGVEAVYLVDHANTLDLLT